MVEALILKAAKKWGGLIGVFFCLCACKASPDPSNNELDQERQVEVDSVRILAEEQIAVPKQETDWGENLRDCNFVYDTITNEDYRMHLVIMDKYHNRAERGFAYTAGGDTLNHFLYHQDISAFTMRLDSTEQGLYRRLTNKVVFLILEEEPKMLDYGLTQWIREDEILDYFMEHVEHPLCNTQPIATTIAGIEKEMGEPHERAVEVKETLIRQLKKGAEFLNE